MYQAIVVLHVLGATIWTGGHLVLAVTVLPRALKARDPAIVQQFEGGYERLGIPALVLQLLTGLWLAYRLLPDPAAWFGFDSPAAAHIFAKLFLLGCTLALALHARLRVVPRLNAERLPTLAAHIILVTILSVLFVIVGVGFRTGGVL
ncbi:MAG: CopD family protein [Gemmatimonadota bacterium]|nr:MAG: CopD family protein [Gemmatimonadota bacterium]